MGSKTLQDVFGRKVMTGSYLAIKPGVPKPLPQAFYTPNRRVKGNQLNYQFSEGTRQTAYVTRYGAKSARYTHTGVGVKPMAMISSFESWDVMPDTLRYLMDENGNDQEFGMSEVMRRLREDKVRADNLRAMAVHSALLSGKIYFDTRELLKDDTGAVIAIDFGIPAVNKGACKEIDGTSDIFSAWATSTTDIDAQLRTLKRTAEQRTGYTIQNAFFGKNIPGYMYSNDTLGNLFNGFAPDAGTIIRGDVPPVSGLNWIDASSIFWETLNDDGTLTANTDLAVGDNDIVFTPAAGQSGWWDFAEGSATIPSTTGLVGSMEEAMRSLGDATGQFAYGMAKMNPVTVEAFHGDTFLPVLNVPAAVYTATVQS